MRIRYEISQKGYSSTKSITLASGLPREAVAEFSESSSKFPGINIVVDPAREYTSGTLAAHILGYASQISSEEYQSRKDTYTQNDIIGKTGIEAVFEEFLKGKNGTKQTKEFKKKIKFFNIASSIYSNNVDSINIRMVLYTENRINL